MFLNAETAVPNVYSVKAEIIFTACCYALSTENNFFLTASHAVFNVSHLSYRHIISTIE